VGFIGLFVLVAGSDPSHLLRGAAGGGALLAFGVVVPGFLILSLVDVGIAHLRRGRRGREAAARLWRLDPRPHGHGGSLNHPGPG
jgi:hypothetical protein